MPFKFDFQNQNSTKLLIHGCMIRTWLNLETSGKAHFVCFHAIVALCRVGEKKKKNMEGERYAELLGKLYLLTWELHL